jgi:hypothetical protein
MAENLTQPLKGKRRCYSESQCSSGFRITFHSEGLPKIVYINSYYCRYRNQWKILLPDCAVK